MKRILPLFLVAVLLVGCTPKGTASTETTLESTPCTIETTVPETTAIVPEVIPRLDTAESEAARLYERLVTDSTLTQADMNDLSYEMYRVWDDLLNEIWQQLATVLPADSMQKLTEEERQWITEKEDAVHRAAAVYGGGSLAGSSANQKAAALTRQRVYYLAGLLTGLDISPSEEYSPLYTGSILTPLVQVLFLPLAEGWHILDYAAFLDSAQTLGVSVIEDEGLFEIPDPDAPDSYLFGSLTTEGGVFSIARLGYCQAGDSGEKHVRVDFSDDTQNYYISAVFWDEGIPVDTLQELLEYLGQ